MSFRLSGVNSPIFQRSLLSRQLLGQDSTSRSKNNAALDVSGSVLGNTGSGGFLSGLLGDRLSNPGNSNNRRSEANPFQLSRSLGATDRSGGNAGNSGNAGGGIGGMLQGLLGNLGNNIQNKLDGALGNLGNIGANIQDKLDNALANVGNVNVGDIQEKVQQKIDNALGNLGNIQETIQQKIDDALARVQDAVDNAGANVNVQDLIDNIKANVQEKLANAGIGN